MIDSSAPNQPIQNYEIVNAGLEQQVASLLPSVAGYGGNLRSTNTIIPVVDLTAAAEGSNVPESLQQAWDFATDLVKHQAASTTALISNPGFWRVDMVVSINDASTADHYYSISDGLTVKKIWQISGGLGSGGEIVLENSFIVFLRAGDTFQVTGANTNFIANTWSRQVATLDGTLVTPLGF